MSDAARPDLARLTLGVMFIGGLTLSSFWIVRPFLPAFIWAVMIVVATWPALLRLQRALGGRRGPAVAVMTVVMLTIFVLPVAFAIGAIAERAAAAVTFIQELPQKQVPPPPAWLDDVPLVGERAAEGWRDIETGGYAQVTALLEPYATVVTSWIVAEAGSFGLMIANCLLIVVLSAVLFAAGERWGSWICGFGRRLAGERGEEAAVLAGKAIRGVALGVIVTALIQSTLGGIGLYVAGVPFAGALTAVMLVLCIAQIGPILVLLAGTAWLYAKVGAGWGTFMLIWSLVVGVMDNFLRPVLIRRGADLPLLLIFAGVIGGLLSFGLVGIFVGPVVLAVTYTLVDTWVRSDPMSYASTRNIS